MISYYKIKLMSEYLFTEVTTMMKIGEKIKHLRRERELTQEILAEFLGVTAQSVSKWERGENCPDISMLPAIAAFFGITTDELLDVNSEERKSKIKAYIDEYNDLRMKNSPYVFSRISKAVREFPGDYDLLVRYLEILIYEKSGADSDSEKIIDEVESIYDRILRFCTDDQIRIQAKRLVCMYYNTLGHTTGNEKYVVKKMAIADEMPNMINSKEYIRTVINLPEDEHFSACRNALGCELLLMLGTVNNLIHYNNKFSAEYKIQAIEKAIGVLKLIYEDGNYGVCYRSYVFMLGELAKIYYEIGNREKTLKYLKNCAEEARRHDSLPEAVAQESLLMGGEIYRKTKYGKTLSERMKRKFTEDFSFSEEFKACKEFEDIMEYLS